MTEKRFLLTKQFNGLQGVTFVKDDCADVDTYYTVDGTVDLLNQFADENGELKKQLHEFRVEKSNRINAFCVTNDEYAVVLLKENEAYMVCNMVNRLIRSCKND